MIARRYECQLFGCAATPTRPNVTQHDTHPLGPRMPPHRVVALSGSRGTLRLRGASRSWAPFHVRLRNEFSALSETWLAVVVLHTAGNEFAISLTRAFGRTPRARL